MRKSLIALLTALVLVIVTACGSNAGNGGESGSGSTSESTNTGSAEAAKDTITVWTYPVYETYEADLKVLVDDFMKEHPNLTVKTEMLSWAEGPQKFDVALNAGNPPDLYFHAVDGAYASSGLELPIDSYLTPEIKNDYYPGTLELAQVQGVQYGLPLYQFQWGWGGNKRLLEEAGIDWQKIQKEGWTWSEFKAAAAKLTKKLPDGSTQYALTTDGTSLDFIELLTRNNGMPDALDENGKLQWNDNRILDTMTFIQDLMKSGYMPKETAALAPKKRTEMFYAGQTALISKAIPYYDVMIQNRNKDIDAGKVQGEKIDFVLLPVPHNDNAPAKAMMGAEGYLMFKQKKDQGEEHAKNAFLVMEALSGAKAGMASNQLVLPFVRDSQAKEFAGKELGQPANIEASKVMATTMQMPITLKLDNDTSAKMKQFKEQVVKPNMQALFAGEKTPDAILQDFVSKGKLIVGK
ncbi:ABC transporter substrate-binding protein [Paenibacillus beijingensis]|uniref:ABC transporter substrate-binding protein n=1 Tax=Paenibacillus beijingensis TaxID=1126833 RepID=UPI003B75BA7E